MQLLKRRHGQFDRSEFSPCVVQSPDDHDPGLVRVVDDSNESLLQVVGRRHEQWDAMFRSWGGRCPQHERRHKSNRHDVLTQVYSTCALQRRRRLGIETSLWVRDAKDVGSGYRGYLG